MDNEGSGHLQTDGRVLENTGLVRILMGVFNSQTYLSAQLDSFWAQSHKNWHLTVSYDGSSDSTLSILQKYQKLWGSDKLDLVGGPGAGFCKNFLSVTAKQSVAGADYYAWADHDDIWLADKLARSLMLLEPYGQDVPALYCSRTILVDSNDRPYGLSRLQNRRPPCFANALVQSLGGANTMVFNRPARDLISLGFSLDLVSHDWWAYQVVSGAGGQVIYDPSPSLRYRQHRDNLVGENVAFSARLSRLAKALNGTLRKLNDINVRALNSLPGVLIPDNHQKLCEFMAIRDTKNPKKRLDLLISSGIYRQGLLEQFALYLAAFLGRL